MNSPQRLLNRFLALSGTAKVQTDKDTGLDSADLTARHKCEISMSEVIQRTEVRDCRGQDLMDETLRSRALRFTFNYSEVTPQILAMWAAYFFGAAASPVGTPANEQQTITVTGDGTLSLTLEGRTVTTKTIPETGLTAAKIRDALTTAAMIFIHPGDVAVTGTGPYVVTFQGRLAHANLATMVGSGGFAVAGTTNGDQNKHVGSRSTGTQKVRFSFALGWDNVSDRVEKYVGYVCESFQPKLDRRQNVSLSVTVIGPWEPEIVTDFSIPDCVNITPLRTDDCKIEINSAWETPDVNTERYNLNDNVPTDETSAYGFDEVDVQDLERGDTPAYSITAGIFASEVDAIYQLAYNERTQDPVDYRTHFGQPGNRFSLLSPGTKIKFQDQRMTAAGALRKSVVQITGTPFKIDSNPPISWEAYLDQSTAFLTS